MIEALEGPERFEGGDTGRQWFSLVGINPDNRVERIAASRPAFDRALAALLAHHGVGKDLSAVALVGFSQGAILALDALVSGRWAIPPIVAYAGRLGSGWPWQPTTASVLLLHGLDDTVILPDQSRLAARVLKLLGARVDLKLLPGEAHVVTAEGVETTCEYLAAAFARLAGNWSGASLVDLARTSAPG